MGVDLKMDIKRCCIFAHYDKQGELDPYVILYLKALLPFVSRLIFVSTCQLSIENLEKLGAIGVEASTRNNIGYDFFSWKEALSTVDLSEYDELLQVNDSCYAPLFDISSMFEKMSASTSDFWGISQSFHKRRHLQSYFVCYRKQVISGDVFKGFWDNLKIVGSKDAIVNRYEIGISQLLLKAGYSMDCYFNISVSTYFNRLPKILSQKLPIKKNLNPYKYFRGLLVSNPTFYHYEEMLAQKVPTIKVSLISDSKCRVTSMNLRKLPSVNILTIEAIQNHQKRLGFGEISARWTEDI
jgi:lipopolysaccharide biosynthesis protein